MKLIELDPEWVLSVDGTRHRSDELNIHTARGVLFLCPVCFVKNNGPVGTESVLCWFRGRGVPDNELPGPGRWDVSGDNFNNLTLHPSVNVANEHWHGWIKNGEVT